MAVTHKDDGDSATKMSDPRQEINQFRPVSRDAEASGAERVDMRQKRAPLRKPPRRG